MLIPHAASWLVDRRFSIVAALVCVLPLALQKDLSALAKITPISILALGLIVLGIVVQTPFESKQHGGINSIDIFKMDSGFFDAFAITLFAFGCTLNVVPVAGSLVRPTRARIIQVSVWTNVVQVLFYLIIAICGYLSFGDDTQGDILNGYPDKNVIVVISRALFSCSMLLSLSMNLSPTVRSGLHLIDYFCASELLLPSPTASPQASPRLGPARGVSLLEGVAAEAAWPRITLTIACLAAQAGIAIAVPGIGDIISIIGGTICPAIMLTIPAYAMGVVMHPMTRRRRIIQLTMYAFSVLGYATAPLKILQLAGILE
jgi:amino acid permease